MVNFRFHIVSLVAVFLALGIGVLMGSTVIDQATIDVLTRNQDRLESRLAGRDRRIGDLSARLDQWEAFGAQARAELLAGRLAGVPVLVVSTEGVDERPVNEMHEWLARAGATDQGTLELTARFALDGPGDVENLAAAAGVTGRRVETVRAAALARLAAALLPTLASPAAGPPAAEVPSPGALLVALREGGFLVHEPSAASPVDLASVPAPDTRLVVVSGPGARVADEVMAVPLVRELARARAAAMVVAEPGPVPGSDGAAPASLVAAVRADDEVASRVSTVDNVGTFVGQVAAVLALEDLASSTRGHYGSGPGADRLVPAPNA